MTHMIERVSTYRVLRELGLKETRLRIWEIICEEDAGIRAERIRQYLKDWYGIEITIQAVIKHLKELESALFIKKRRKPTDPFSHPYYVPSQTGLWLWKTTIDNLYKQYKFKPLGIDSKFRRKSVDFPFRQGQEKSLADFETNLIESEREVRKSVVSIGPHWWFLKGYKSQVLEMMNKVTHSGYDVIGICFEDNPVARNQALRGKGDLGINLSICPGRPYSNVYFYVYGPFVMMAFYPDNVNREVSRLFRSYRGLDEIPKKEFEEMLESRNPVRFAYAINEEFASWWQEEGRHLLRFMTYPSV
jgi:DNA-binding MarR family transcriptional regulator